VGAIFFALQLPSLNFKNVTLAVERAFPGFCGDFFFLYKRSGNRQRQQRGILTWMQDFVFLTAGARA